MIAHVARREVAEHVRSVRFLALCALAVLLLPLGAHLEADAYARRRAYADWLAEQRRERAARADASMDPDEGVQWGWNAGEPRSDAALVTVRPPAALAPLVAGDDAALPAFWQHSSEGVVAGGDAPRGAGPPLDALFVVQTVIGLLAVLLTFDAVAGEQESGVLRLVLAHPVPRVSLLLGKLAGALLTLAVPMTLGAGAAVALLLARGVPLLEQGGLPRLALLALAATLYAAVMLGTGLAASVLAPRGKTALVVLLVAWAVLVLVLPRAATVAAATLRPVAGEEVARRERRDAVLALERERAVRLAAAWRRASGGDLVPAGEFPPALRARYDAARGPVEAELFRRKRQVLAELDARRRSAAERQQALARTLAAASPAALLEAAATALAGTGPGRRATWERQLAAQQERLEREAFDRVYGVELFDPRANGLRVRWSPDVRDPRDRPPRYAELPAHRLVPPSARDAVREALPPMLAMLAMAASAVGVAAVAMVRYEVR